MWLQWVFGHSYPVRSSHLWNDHNRSNSLSLRDERGGMQTPLPGGHHTRVRNFIQAGPGRTNIQQDGPTVTTVNRYRGLDTDSIPCVWDQKA